jgi:hypothetical protein
VVGRETGVKVSCPECACLAQATHRAALEEASGLYLWSFGSALGRGYVACRAGIMRKGQFFQKDRHAETNHRGRLPLRQSLTKAACGSPDSA